MHTEDSLVAAATSSSRDETQRSRTTWDRTKRSSRAPSAAERERGSGAERRRSSSRSAAAEAAVSDARQARLRSKARTGLCVPTSNYTTLCPRCALADRATCESYKKAALTAGTTPACEWCPSARECLPGVLASLGIAARCSSCPALGRRRCKELGGCAWCERNQTCMDLAQGSAADPGCTVRSLRIDRLNFTLLPKCTMNLDFGVPLINDGVGHLMLRVKARTALTVKLDWDELEQKVLVGEGYYGRVFKGTWRGNEVAIKEYRSDNMLVVSIDITSPTHLKLTDFGASRLVSDEDAATYTQGVGTCNYMAPEILNNLPYSSKCDVYSYALVVWMRRGDALVFERGSGGLVSGLSALKGRSIVWVGWPGPVADADVPETAAALPAMGFHPVFLPLDLSDKFYEGYCNGAVWPMFHSMPGHSKTQDDEWVAFKVATKLFADEVVKVYQKGDTIWIQDYHLLLLPTELRKRLGDATMSLFLHIPFPHVDVLRLLPNHTTIVESMLQVDLIGFHTTEYASNFIGCMNRLRGVSPVLGRALIPSPPPQNGHLIQISAFPMGIDYEKFAAGGMDEKLIAKSKAIRGHLGTEKVVFSVSRLDYTKGVPNSLVAMRAFLKEYPEWVGRIVFVLVVVPSRTRVDKYAELKQEIDRLVGEINGEFCTPTWSPVLYMYRSFGWEDLVSLYLAADIGLIIPLRDGMNLCAKEYVAVHAEGPGVLVLSILAGAAKEMIESVIVNPNSVESVVRGLKQAVDMPQEEQVLRMTQMAARLRTDDIGAWTESIFKSLAEIKSVQENLAVCKFDTEVQNRMIKDFHTARSRLIVLDYDGTLVNFVDDPAQARPDQDLTNLLSDLSHLPNTTVLVLSGRDRYTLGDWLAHLSIDLAAEHGSFEWKRQRGTWERNPRLITDNKWKPGIRAIMEDTVKLLPGSFIEEKDFSLVFHFRACSSAQNQFLERKKIMDAVLSLKATLIANSSGLPIRVMDAKEALEVKTIGCSKGDFFTGYAETMAPPPDWILAIGDDTTDEDIFEAMRHGYSLRVGFFPSHAHHNIASVEAVRALLASIVVGAKDLTMQNSRVSFSI
eukprot:m51a1_g9075 putative transcriptional antiterminator (1075) ;mRNA; r:146057-153300